MRDSRVRTLAHKLVSFSCNVQSGENVLIENYDENADGNMPERMHSIGQMLMPVLYVCLIAIGIYLLYKILARLVHFLMTKRVTSSDQIELVPAQKTDEEKKQRKKKDRPNFEKSCHVI